MKRLAAMLLLVVMSLTSLWGCAVRKNSLATTGEPTGDITPATEATESHIMPDQTDYEGWEEKAVVLSNRRKFIYKNMFFN